MSGAVSRRRFLQLAGGTVASTMLSDSIARALAIPAHRATRSLRDVEPLRAAGRVLAPQYRGITLARRDSVGSGVSLPGAVAPAG